MTQKNWASPGSRECPPGINIQLTNAMTMSAKVGEVLKSKFLRKRKHLCGIPEALRIILALENALSATTLARTSVSRDLTS